MSRMKRATLWQAPTSTFHFLNETTIHFLQIGFLTTTDPRGRFAFQGVPKLSVPPGYIVFAAHPEAGWVVNVEVRNTNKPSSPTLIITLARPTERITGRVVNPAGEPVPGATVRITRTPFRYVPPSLFSTINLFSTTTNENGRFHINVPSNASVTLTISKDSYATHNRMIDTATRTDESLLFVLPYASYVTATFVDEDSGKPAEGVLAKVASPIEDAPYYPNLQEKTDALGKVRLKVPSETEVLIFTDDLLSGAYAPIKVDPLAPGETRDLGTVPVRRNPNLTITLAPPKGVPIQEAGISIQLRLRVGRTQRYEYSRVELGKDLKGEIPLADGKYTIDAWGATPDEKHFYSPPKTITISQGKLSTEAPLVINLEEPKRDERQEQRQQTYSVVTIFRPDGRHPPRAWVGGGDWDGNRITWTEQGKVTLYPYFIESARQLIILDPDTLSGTVQTLYNPPKAFSVRLQPLPTKSVTVATQEGKPIFRARLYLEVYYEANIFGRTGIVRVRLPLKLTTDAQGSARVPYLPGIPCWVIAYRPGYAPVGTRLDNAPSKEITLTLSPATTSYTGIVISKEGTPLKGILVQAQPEVTWLNEAPPPFSTSSAWDPPIMETSTDAQGRFAVYGMPQKIDLTIKARHPYVGSYIISPEPGIPILLRLTDRNPYAGVSYIETETDPNIETAQTVRHSLKAPAIKHHLKTNVRWLNGEPEWDRNPTLVLFTAPYLQENEEWLEALAQAGARTCKVAMILDVSDQGEAREYSKEIDFTGTLGMWDPQGYTPKSFAGIGLPVLPYPVLLNTKGEIIAQGFRKEELAELLRSIQPQEEQL